MKPGKLRHRVEVKHDTSGDGAEVATWETLLWGVPANVIDVSGGEVYRGKQLEADTRHIVHMRYSSSITPAMRLLDQLGRTLVINSIMDMDGRQRDVMLQCVEHLD